MRLGRVQFRVSYVVDLDNPDMVDHATDALRDDIAEIFGEWTIADFIEIAEAKPTDTPHDIPEFLHTTEEE